MDKVAVIFNPEKVDKGRLERAVDTALQQTNNPPAIYLPTSALETGYEQAVQAVAEGCTLVLGVGGDGTLRPIIQGLAGSEAALGIVPRGTANALARNLGIPIGNMSRAVARAVTGSVRSIDVGLATLKYLGNRPTEVHAFAVMAGMGLDAKIIMNTDTNLKRRLGWVAYIDGGFRSLPSRFERMDVSVNSRTSKTLKVHSLLIGNCGFLAGNITLMPDARLDDGLLDVAYVGPRRFWNWIDFWNRVTWISWTIYKIRAWRKLSQRVENIKTLENLNGKIIEVWPEHPVNIQLDGDGFGLVHSASFEVSPQALKIRL